MRETILSEEDIRLTCNRLAKEIEDKLKDCGDIPIFIGIMNGALPFFFELIKHIKMPIFTDTLQTSSYDGTSSSGKVIIKKKPDFNLEGKTIVLVEDIIDTGLTMHELKKYILENYKPKKIYICTLIKRYGRDAIYDEQADFTGVTLTEKRYLVGFGLDYYELLRNEPYVYVPSKEDMDKWDSIIDKEKNR